MKKLLFLFASMMIGFNAFAFEFDGINLNDDAGKVTRAISSKNYVHDPSRNCLKGNCHGTEIYLSFNLKDVNTKGKIGQLIIDVPMKGSDALQNCVGLLNVIYHQVSSSATSVAYAVDPDGTILEIQKTEEGVKLTYNTPYYQK